MNESDHTWQLLYEFNMWQFTLESMSVALVNLQRFANNHHYVRQFFSLFFLEINLDANFHLM